MLYCGNRFLVPEIAKVVDRHADWMQRERDAETITKIAYPLASNFKACGANFHYHEKTGAEWCIGKICDFLGEWFVGTVITGESAFVSCVVKKENALSVAKEKKGVYWIRSKDLEGKFPCAEWGAYVVPAERLPKHKTKTLPQPLGAKDLPASDPSYLFPYDTETALIQPGILAPLLTCLTYTSEDQEKAHLLDHTEAVARFRAALEDGALIVGQNVAYDNAVMAVESPDLLPLIFKAYKENRVTDTMIRQQIADISSGEFRGYLDKTGVWRKRDYSLASLTMRHFKIALEKDEWRLRYGEFRDVPIEQWPEGAREYPRKDAESTRDVYLKQEQMYGTEILADQYRQSYAAFCLHLCSAWGIHTSEEGVRQLEQATEAARSLLLEELQREGLIRKDGSRDTKKAKAQMIKVMGGEDKCRKTAAGGICLDEDACEQSEDELMQNYARFSTLNKVMTTDVELLRAGITTPVQTRYGLTDTGRTTSSKPNIQNLRRMPGVREAFIPRKGFVFAQADYHAFELFALGQTCLDLFGHSNLAEAVNNGLDAHTQVAATILHKPYDEVAKLCKDKDHDADMARQTGKVANFGFPGGLGPTRLVDYAWKGYGVKITEAEARELKNNWVLTWPEMTEFFEHVSSLKNDYGGYNVFLPRSKRWRGNTTFCAAANTFFQGQAADAAKVAITLVTEACYIDRNSPLFGSRLVAFVHDELILESPEAVAAEAAEELSRLMVQGARVMLPDMNIRAEPCLMAYWSKNAKTIRDDAGRLVLWDGRKA